MKFLISEDYCGPIVDYISFENNNITIKSMKTIFKVDGKRIEIVVEDGEITTAKVFDKDGGMNWVEIADGIIANNETQKRL